MALEEIVAGPVVTELLGDPLAWLYRRHAARESCPCANCASIFVGSRAERERLGLPLPEYRPRLGPDDFVDELD